MIRVPWEAFRLALLLYIAHFAPGVTKQDLTEWLELSVKQHQEAAAYWDAFALEIEQSLPSG